VDLDPEVIAGIITAVAAIAAAWNARPRRCNHDDQEDDRGDDEG
jgi:hypothetical protein